MKQFSNHNANVHLSDNLQVNVRFVLGKFVSAARNISPMNALQVINGLPGKILTIRAMLETLKPSAPSPMAMCALTRPPLKPASAQEVHQAVLP